jgi:hypothetical protein
VSDQFTIDGDLGKGRVFAKLGLSDVTWEEADLIEQVTGTPITKITLERAHEILAFQWIAVRRARPGTTFGEMTALTVGATRSVPDPAEGDGPDPTQAGDPARNPAPNDGTSDSPGSPASPTSSESDPGNGTG